MKGVTMADKDFFVALVEGVEGRLAARIDALKEEVSRQAAATEKLRDISNETPKQVEIDRIKTDVQKLLLAGAVLNGKASQRDLNITRLIAYAGLGLAILSDILRFFGIGT